MKKRKFLLNIIMVFIISFSMMGCNSIDKLKIKMGIANEEFDFLLEGNTDKITIQSVRDPGFKFIVTDKQSIADMHKILSKGKKVDEKSKLDPDYIFQFASGDEVKSFNYIVGAEKGNFYNDNESYTVSKRIDESIMENLSVVRGKPRNFEVVYYDSILKVLELKKDELKKDDYKVGIDIRNDADCLKYIFSRDLEEFVERAKKIIPNVSIINDSAVDYDVVLTIRNNGYDTTKFKTKINVNNRKDKIQEDYYIKAENEFKDWKISVSEPNTQPQDW